MTNEIKRSDTNLAVEFIQRGQDALGQPNVVMLVRPDKIIEQVNEEIARLRVQIHSLSVQLGQLPISQLSKIKEVVIMDQVAWQNEGGRVLAEKQNRVTSAKDRLFDLDEKVRKRIQSCSSYADECYRRGDSGAGQYQRNQENINRELLESNRLLIEEARRNLWQVEAEVDAAKKEYERRRDPEYYGQYKSRLLIQASDAGSEYEARRWNLTLEIAKLEEQVTKMREYISAVIAKAISQV